MQATFWRNLKLTAGACAVFTLGALLVAFLVAFLRGDMLFDGSVGEGAPRSFWVWYNFKGYAPYFVGGGALLGAVAGQLQFWALTKSQVEK